MTRPIADLDVPLPDLKRQMRQRRLRDLVARQRAEFAARIADPCELCDAPTPTTPEEAS